jgi:hypothetical protein
MAQALKDILMRDNRLSGAIPSELGLITGFQNRIPPSDEWRRELEDHDHLNSSQVLLSTTNHNNSSISGLERLWLDKNPITGTIPTELSLITSLVSFTFAETNLEGPIPEGLCNATDLVLGCSEDVCGCGCNCTTSPPASTNICAPYQYYSGKYCYDCEAGKVANDDGTECEYCPEGEVRENSAGTGTSPGVCVSSVGICEPYQYSAFGKCYDCEAGMVGNGLDTECEYCPVGEVRENSAGTGTSPGVCVSSVGICEPYQYSAFGKCYDCEAGMVGNGLDTECEYCPVGEVRENSAGTGTSPGVCVSSVGICEPYQYSAFGKCYDCEAGMVGNGLDTECEYCPEGEVRENSAGTGTSPGVCVSSVGICEPYQYSAFGKCYDCEAGMVGNGLDAECEYCPEGEVRENSAGTGTSPGACVSAFGICTSNQYATFGKCYDCEAGQESSQSGGNYDHLSCVPIA